VGIDAGYETTVAALAIAGAAANLVALLWLGRELSAGRLRAD
jgi:HAMP domain-containing protein